MVKRKSVFAAYDDVLRTEIMTGLLPHFDVGEVILHNAHDPIPRPYASHSDLESEQDRLRMMLAHASMLILGFTGITTKDFESIETAAICGKPCGLILKTANPELWQRLKEMHEETPFAFVVSYGGPRADSITTYFRATPHVTDVTSLREPGAEIVHHIRRWIVRAQAPAIPGIE